ncbi:MAG TPA: cyanophycinase [Bacteroidales bacterium]|nr:cyanophycinase [Bacteroidales bacterium]
MNVPKGKLIPVGGNEAKEYDDEIVDELHQNIDFGKGVLKEIVKEMRKSKPKIVLLPIASAHQEEVAEIYNTAFGKIGQKTDPIIVHEKDDLDDKKNLHKIEEADGIFISGGDQARLKKVLNGTRFLEILHERYMNEEFVIAGTSAGAMILSEYMIDTGASQESVIKGIIKLQKGFGFLHRAIIDTHFFNRGRFARLTEGLLQKKNLTGIGISEDTALVVVGGNHMRAIGSGTVIIMENDEVKSTNYDDVADKDPIFIENLIVHILSRGAAYLLKEKKFLVM